MITTRNYLIRTTIYSEQGHNVVDLYLRANQANLASTLHALSQSAIVEQLQVFRLHGHQSASKLTPLTKADIGLDETLEKVK